MEIREAARLLYLGGMEQQDIAGILKRSKNTISAWKIEGDWDEHRRRRELQAQSSEEAIRELIDYQLAAIRELKEKWLRERRPDEPPKLIERGEIDALQKLYSTIRRSERTWEDTVYVLRDFLLWLERNNLPLAKQLTTPTQHYLNERRNG